MANSVFEVDTGMKVTGDITTTGNVVMSSAQTVSYNANSLPPKQYVDVIAVVFGS